MRVPDCFLIESRACRSIGFEERTGMPCLAELLLKFLSMELSKASKIREDLHC